MNKQFVLALLASVSLAQAGDSTCIQQREMKVSQVFFYYQNNKWVMNLEGKLIPIEKHNVDQLIRDIPADKVEEVLKHVAISAVQTDRGEFMLQAHVKGLGGGPIAAIWAYNATKAAGIASLAALIAADPLVAIEAPALLSGIEGAAILAGVAAGACLWLP